ncbi:coniferyl aldehyde dehydrogenase [Agrobacterium larrymoorei]|uniref:Aldehyde dehydrogenase n=1 Tax=Agrobacterium larrymoorei TaxID=160699 RepID=A0A4D7DSD5_9HYPH|nr:coniferyl aldehyde dehydrogenase [Agrobacterium larrymoorei]QCI98294.1 coniferyl aldehyde dehydrogenase [Agrobacterium larrymoorei]QYA06251.1 coniferyl aldehyde dehydrogenase [Agrobacterium larrymoorei]
MSAAEVLHKQRDALIKNGPPTLVQRRADLNALRKAVTAHRKRIEEAVDADFGGRSPYETALLDIVGVVQAIDYLSRNLKRFMKPERRHVAATFQRGRAWVEYQPLGVIGIMSPWNYPFLLAMVPLATALAAGNRAMLKPSELTPRTSQLMKDMLAAIFPEEKVSVVLGDAEVGAEFSGLPFDHLFFTGSTQVGRMVMKAASENLVPVTLELGGKSPTIIQQGHVNAESVASITFGKLANAGQTCVAPDYVFVHETEIEAFVDAFDQAVVRSYPDGIAAKDYASIISDRHFTRLNALLEDARGKGAALKPAAKMAQAGTRMRVLTPTLVLNPTDDMAVMQEEIFGPILPVRSYRDVSEVVAYINAKPRPLALYIFGEEQGDVCREILARTTSGNVGINNTVLHVAQDDLPFGGVGPSGMGAYHGIEGFRRMSHAKGVFSQGRFSVPSLLRPPFGQLAKAALAFLLR